MAHRSLPQFAQKVENEMMTVENIYAIALVGFPIVSKKIVNNYSTNSNQQSVIVGLTP